MVNKVDVFLMEFTDKYYVGNPYYVTGNAILHATRDKLSYKEKNEIKVSHGIFVNMYKDFHKKYREKGRIVPYKIPEVKSYHDFFKLRRKPFVFAKMDEYDMPSIHKYNGHKIQKRRFLTFYVIGLENKKAFENIQVGGLKNYGFGKLKLVDHKRIDLRKLDYSCLEKDNLSVELITPLCLKSEYPNTKKFSKLPTFMSLGDGSHKTDERVRLRKEIIEKQMQDKELELVDNGQIFKYTGGEDSKKYTARKGIEGILNHSKYGYGEFVLR